VKLKLGEQPEEMKLGMRGGRGSQGEDETQADAKNTLGMTLSDLNDQTRERFGLESDVKGALVREIDQKSAAAREGIRVGDVITKVGTQSVATAKEAREALAKADVSKGVRLYVVGRDASRFVFVQNEK
jgi:serine protease Do